MHHVLGRRSLPLCRLALAWLCGMPLLAQEFAWRLPRRGALEYRRTGTAAVGELAKTPAAARTAAATAKVPDGWLPRLPPAPFLLQTELDPAQQVIADPIRDPRDVLRAVACGLGGRSVKLRLPRVLPFGDLTITGSWSAPTAGGGQQLRADVASKPPAALPGERSGLADRLRPFCVGCLDGTLAVTRQVDAAAGLVTSFAAELDVVVDLGERRYRRFVLREDWTMVAVRELQDADFRKRVAQAIRLGVGFVRAALDDRKSFLLDSGKENRSYGSGRLALGLLTLLHGGVAKDDPVVVRGFAELIERQLVDTYSLAAALMAVAARYAPPGEAAALRDGDLPAPPRRQLPPAEREAVARWTAQLLKNVDPRTDPAKVLRFNYVAGPRYDTSLQQYGLLGLWSAWLCGVEVPGSAFAAAARHLLAVQGDAEARLPLQLVDHRALRAVAGTDLEPTVGAPRVAARGFAYEEAIEPAFGSMTSAGVSGLLLARAGMAATGHPDRSLLPAIDAGIADGFGWLAHEFTVRANPGFAERADNHWYYWLYGLERSCELHGIAWLQGRDWYHEGALQLFAAQQANGSFRAENPASLLIESTCFAVLFLARSTPAVPVTGR